MISFDDMFLGVGGSRRWAERIHLRSNTPVRTPTNGSALIGMLRICLIGGLLTAAAILGYLFSAFAGWASVLS